LLTPLNAALVIGLAWGLWHIPRDVVGGVVERLGLVQYLFLYLPSFVLGTVSTSIIIGYFMNRTGGSVLPAIMIHGLNNDALGIAGEATMVIALAPYHQLTQNVPLAVFAVVLVVLNGSELGRVPSDSQAVSTES
jgi:membrane protease YdiL (CAAX protease family)